VTILIFEKVFKQINYFKDKQISFIAWVCPLLKHLVKMDDQYIFYEGDEISAIYFH